MHNILELRKIARDILSKNQDYKISALESDLILSNILKKDRIYLELNPNEEINEKIEKEFLENIQKRSDCFPVAYIIGKKEFMEYEFLVEEGILIPRDDTGVVIEATLDNLKNKEKIYGLEIGVGSGIITGNLLMKKENLEMVSCDINERALELSKKNIEHLEKQNPSSKLKNRVKFVYSDIFKEIDKSVKFDFIISNPPYIRSDEIQTLSQDIKKFEPINALDGGEDGLYFYKKIIEEGYDLLKKEGFFAFEIGYNQFNEVRNILENKNINKTKLYKDMSGLDRAIIGHK